MASFTPYTYIQCPCYDTAGSEHNDPADAAADPSTNDGESDGNAFDPRSSRSSYSLYPPEYLLYCDVCQQIRCPRCVSEELVNIYCPNCLFEVATSSLKTEGNRYGSDWRSWSECDVPKLPNRIMLTRPNSPDVHAAASSAQSALGLSQCKHSKPPPSLVFYRLTTRHLFQHLGRGY